MTCNHPPKRLYSWFAHDGTLCVGCCQCKAVLKGASPDPQDIAAMSTPELVALNDSRACDQTKAALVREEIVRRHKKAVANDGTVLSLDEWKAAHRRDGGGDILTRARREWLVRFLLKLKGK